MSRLMAGDHVATVPCGTCGAACAVVLNKRGGAWYTCQSYRDDGRRCGHMERWGTSASILIQRRCIAAGRVPVEASRADLVAQPEPAPPAAVPDPAGGGSADATPRPSSPPHIAAQDPQDEDDDDALFG